MLMTRHKVLTCTAAVALAVAAMMLAPQAQAGTVQLNGTLLTVTVNSLGTMGNEQGFGGPPPGLLWNSTGQDILVPGDPWQGYTLSYNGGFLYANNDQGGAAPTWAAPGGTSLMNTSFDNTRQALFAATTVIGGGVQIVNQYTFSVGSNTVNVASTIYNYSGANMTNVKFASFIDPDPDRYMGGVYWPEGTYVTKNAVLDGSHVTAAGPITGLTLKISTQSAVPHGVGISSEWSNDLNAYLTTLPMANVGDYTIGVGFNIGTLANGFNQTLDYQYSVTPLPAALPLFGAALAGLGVFGWRMGRRHDA